MLIIFNYKCFNFAVEHSPSLSAEQFAHRLCLFAKLPNILFRMDGMTNKMDRLMESMFDAPETDDERVGVPEPRPMTRDFGGLERRLSALEVHIASTGKTVMTILELLKRTKVRELPRRIYTAVLSIDFDSCNVYIDSPKGRGLDFQRNSEAKDLRRFP